jgi:hypothetical protein
VDTLASSNSGARANTQQVLPEQEACHIVKLGDTDWDVHDHRTYTFTKVNKLSESNMLVPLLDHLR